MYFLQMQILFYQCSCSVTPIYVFPICVPAEPKATTVSSSFTYMCHSATFLEALQQSMQYIPFSQRDFSSTSLSLAGESLAVILAEAKRQGRPVVLFVEGVRTNGSGVLEFRSEVHRLHLLSNCVFMFLYSLCVARVVVRCFMRWARMSRCILLDLSTPLLLLLLAPWPRNAPQAQPFIDSSGSVPR